MTKYSGKDFLLLMETATPGTFAVIGSLTANSVTVNREPIDVTDKANMPWKEILPNQGLMSLGVEGSGFVDNSANFKKLMADTMAGTTRQRIRLISGAGDRIEGDFELSNLQRSGEKAGAEEYSVSLESSGAPTYTPPA